MTSRLVALLVRTRREARRGGLSSLAATAAGKGCGVTVAEYQAMVAEAVRVIYGARR